MRSNDHMWEEGYCMILSKKQMSEEDIKLQYITPAITSNWNIQKITMET
jgi:type I restriction enzyme R subunit